MRAFANSSFSIDPSVTVLGATGKEDIGGASFDQSALTFLLGVSVSGWIDMASTVAPAAPIRVPESNAEEHAVTAPASAIQPQINSLGEPEATLETDDDGTMRAEIEVANRWKIRVIGRPIRDARA